MDRLLALTIFVLAIGLMAVGYPTGPLAVFFGSICAAFVLLVINKTFTGEEQNFIRRIFIIGLILRCLIAALTYSYDLQGFFGGDSITYDGAGFALYNDWFGNAQSPEDVFYLRYATRSAGSGWGMAYLVAAIYTIVGRNPFAIQLFNSVLGAATSILAYVCATTMIGNQRVARTTAILIAVFPSLVLWSSQGLKDGIICFLLILAVNAVFSLQKKFGYLDIIILLFSLLSIYALRFYIFFAFAVAVLGSFFIGAEKSAVSVIRQLFILLVLAIGLTYFGVLDSAQRNINTFGSLERLQESRLDQSKSAKSGFGQDIDVSTSEGAIQALPIGLIYILFAPFPWQVTNFRQAITLPEVFLWWAMIPFMISGIWYAVKNKFRESFSVLIFTLLLTVSYALFQGNVGTAYRMRAQMQIFYFIFVAVGIVLWQENKENKKILNKVRKIR